MIPEGLVTADWDLSQLLRGSLLEFKAIEIYDNILMM